MRCLTNKHDWGTPMDNTTWPLSPKVLVKPAAGTQLERIPLGKRVNKKQKHIFMEDPRLKRWDDISWLIKIG